MADFSQWIGCVLMLSRTHWDLLLIFCNFLRFYCVWPLPHAPRSAASNATYYRNKGSVTLECSLMSITPSPKSKSPMVNHLPSLEPLAPSADSPPIVRSFGTETRPTPVFIPAIEQPFPLIEFMANDLTDLQFDTPSPAMVRVKLFLQNLLMHYCELL
jgi:hypothetical protein